MTPAYFSDSYKPPRLILNMIIDTPLLDSYKPGKILYMEKTLHTEIMVNQLLKTFLAVQHGSQMIKWYLPAPSL